MSVVTATVLSQGKTMDPACQLVSIDVRREVDRIPAAHLTLLDGDLPQREFPVSDTAFFEPGKEIEIKLRYEGDASSEKTVFKGLVVRHGVEAGAGYSLLTVEMKDAAVRLTQGRKSKVFRKQSDDEVIGALLQDAGLKKGEIVKTQPKHPELVQYHCTDWDFLLARADLQGLRVVVEDGAVSARLMDPGGAAKHHFEYGLGDIYEFEMEADAGSQAPDLSAAGWDLKEQKPSKAASAKSVKLAQGNLDGSQLAKALHFEEGVLVHSVPLDPKELQAGVDGRMARSRLSLLRGRISVPGFATVKLLDVLEIGGIGQRFNGKTVITGFRHRVEQGGWRTDLQFGLSPAPFCRQPGIQESPAAGFLPAISGLQIGVVEKFEEDPDKHLRVRVGVPALGDKAGPLWARLASPDAGKDRGWYFRPEVGDEVVLGFFNEDPRQPVILGALFSSKNTSPAAFKKPEDKNINKGIVSKKGTKIFFVDADKPAISVETPAGNKIRLDDDAKSIELTDQHGNKVTMNKDGIVLKSAKDLKLEADSNITIKGSKVDVQ